MQRDKIDFVMEKNEEDDNQRTKGFREMIIELSKIEEI